jgi:hypothetical protein
MTEQFANGPFSSLNGAITSGALTLVVNSATNYSTSGNFRILVGSEIMLVTGVSGTTFTVTRAQEGTAAAAHADGSQVIQLVTAGALAQLKLDAIPVSTTTSSNFTQPAIGSTVSVSVANTVWMYVGLFVYVGGGGGYYSVNSITNSTTVVLKNLGDVSNAAAAGTISSGASVIHAGYPHFIAAAQVATAESTASTGYVDLTTAGPSVTLVTGTSVIVEMAGIGYMTSGSFTGSNYTTVAVSGATTVAASDSHATLISPASNTGRFGWSDAQVLTGLTAGTNTFKLQYRVDSGTHTWERRAIKVTTL